MKHGSAPMIAVSGVKNSGKTTLLEKLVAALAARGDKVAVIKHDGHLFDLDAPGTDSHRYCRAGAYGAAVYDREKFLLVKNSSAAPEELAAFFPEADLIFVEGAKYSPLPKIEIVRGGNSEQPVADPATLLALVTDLPITVPGVPSLGLADLSGLLRIILAYRERFDEHR